MSNPEIRDFLISYNRHDKQWARWIAWTLEEAGYTVMIQAWDFKPGGNFILDMQRAISQCQKTIAVCSENYLQSAYIQPEVNAAFAQYPISSERKVIPVKVADCKLTGMLAQIVYVDLVGLTEKDAADALLGAFKERAKPEQKPLFPGIKEPDKTVHLSRARVMPEHVSFPGEETAGGNVSTQPFSLTVKTMPPIFCGESIFISYRRTDSADAVGRIYDHLVAHFGEGHVFLDQDSIVYGTSFPQRIRPAIENCKAMLVVIGSGWLSVVDDEGNRRLDTPDDWVRQEIELAFKSGVYVIPVLLNGASMPSKRELPQSIQGLSDINGCFLTTRQSTRFFKAGMDEIIDAIEGNLLAASPADPDAIEAIEQLTQLQGGVTASTASQETAQTTTVQDAATGQFKGDQRGETGVEIPVVEPQMKEPQSRLSTFEFEVVTVDERGQEVSRKRQEAEYFAEKLDDDMVLEMVKVPRGMFTMGSPGSEAERDDNEGHQHLVRIAQPFFMGRYAVTQAQWFAVAHDYAPVNRELKPDPSNFKGPNRPVECIDWHEAVEFCDRLSQRTGRQYRLPSEAEWEYACRAGTTTPFHFGETITTDLANYDGTEVYGSGVKGVWRQATTPVGSFGVANAFGLYDMHGNVYEWCEDHYHKSYEGAPSDGSAWLNPEAGENVQRVLRGGSWINIPRNCRSAYRYTFSPDFRDDVIGFRVVCVAPRTL